MWICALTLPTLSVHRLSNSCLALCCSIKCHQNVTNVNMNMWILTRKNGKKKEKRNLKAIKPSHTHTRRLQRVHTNTSKERVRPIVFHSNSLFSVHSLYCSWIPSFACHRELSVHTTTTTPYFLLLRERHQLKCYERNYLLEGFHSFWWCSNVKWSECVCGKRRVFPKQHTTDDVYTTFLHFHFHPSHNIVFSFLSFFLFFRRNIHKAECQVEWKFFSFFFGVFCLSCFKPWFPWLQAHESCSTPANSHVIMHNTSWAKVFEWVINICIILCWKKFVDENC